MSDTETSPGTPAQSARPVRRAPMPLVTYGIIAANVLVFGWTLTRGLDFMSPKSDVILDVGADHAPLVVAGEWWRLLTCMFVHAGIIHIAFNMWALRALGPAVEMLFGRVPFVILYLLAGLGGSIASCIWHPHGISVGASGAIFGLPGAIMAFFLMHRSELPPGLFRAQMKSLGMFLGINLLIGFSIPHIDVSAHVGGLVTGFAGGLAAYTGRRWSSGISMKQSMRLALIAVVLVALLPVVRWRVLNDRIAALEYQQILGK